MYKFILGSVLSSSLLLANQIPSNHITPLSGVAGSNGMVFPKGKSRIVLKHIYLNKDTSYNGDSKLNDPKNRYMKVNITKLVYRQGLGNNFDFRIILPYIKKEANVNNFSNTSNGIGDMKIISRYQILNQKKGDPLFLAFGLGVKLPTGNTDETFTIGAKKVKNPSWQVGSGSTDFIAEIGLSKILPNSRVDSHILYKKNQEGDNNYEFGDTIKWNLGYSYALNKNFDLALTLHGQNVKKHKSNGITQEHTGGNFIYLAPSVHYKINKKFDLSASYSHMIDRNNNYNSKSNIGGLSEDGKFMIRIGYNF